MESAIEKLRKYRDEDYHLHDEIIELWANILSECDLSILGDEKWLILEQVFKSALHCSKESMAHQCLERIEKQFEKTSPLLITLNAMYFESIEDFEKAEQICSTLIEENETDDIKKFLGLTNYLLHICRKSHGLPLTCLKLIEGYCQKITKCINDDNSLLNDMKNVLNEIKDLLQLIDLNDIQTAKINRITQNEINQMKKELLNVKHQYEHQNSALDELRKEIIDLRKQSSMQVLKEASAHSLIPFVEQLEIIKSDVALDEGPLTTIDNVINDFVKQSKIAKPDFIDLLINKTNRNQRENSIKLIVDDNDKVNLIKLLKLNIKLRRKQNSLNVFLNQFDTLQERNDMIIAPFRMSIVEQDKENGAIVMGEIESGSCHIGDQCLIMPNQTRVEITNIYHEDSKTDSGVYG
ncbi:unnamed protein product [Rotaria sordida]|uniref:ER membrane protein complex subunit 2 n=1 Tax=Rotaria sordida TaxID=392033 RepID=A0A813W1L4_9BILA|nr:unnamed protein product [Rotaria sordida]CAF1130005.1 unnamed protein product [Rotaria sordida]